MNKYAKLFFLLIYLPYSQRPSYISLHSHIKNIKFLIRKGVKKAKEKGLELIIGDEVMRLDNPQGELNIPTTEDRVDAREIVALVADDYPGITTRYLANMDKLERL